VAALVFEVCLTGLSDLPLLDVKAQKDWERSIGRIPHLMCPGLPVRENRGSSQADTSHPVPVFKSMYRCSTPLAQDL
jgi:hypothetical protein